MFSEFPIAELSHEGKEEGWRYEKEKWRGGRKRKENGEEEPRERELKL